MRQGKKKQDLWKLYEPTPFFFVLLSTHVKSIYETARMSSGQGKRGLCVAHLHLNHCWKPLKSLPWYWTFKWSLTLTWRGLWAAIRVSSHHELWVWSPNISLRQFCPRLWQGCVGSWRKPWWGDFPRRGSLSATTKPPDFSVWTTSHLSSFRSFPTQAEFKSVVLKGEVFYFTVNTQSCLALCKKSRRVFFFNSLFSLHVYASFQT